MNPPVTLKFSIRNEWNPWQKNVYQIIYEAAKVTINNLNHHFFDFYCIKGLRRALKYSFLMECLNFNYSQSRSQRITNVCSWMRNIIFLQKIYFTSMKTTSDLIVDGKIICLNSRLLNQAPISFSFKLYRTSRNSSIWSSLKSFSSKFLYASNSSSS